MAEKGTAVEQFGYSSTARKTLILGVDGSTPATALNPLPTTATISGDVNVDSTSIDTSGYVGKASGTNADFTIAYLAGTTITLSNYPSGVTAFTADDIASVVQVATDGSVTAIYSRDDSIMTLAANVLTVASATFAASDTFVVYTNVARSSAESVSETYGTILVGKETGNYSFDASAQEVTITGMPTLNLEDIRKIINVTDNVIIYDAQLAGKGGSIAFNVITCTYNTTSMADADNLAIYVKFTNSEDFTLGVQKTIPQANAAKSVTSPEAYTTFTPVDVAYDEGAVIDTRDYVSILFHYSKTASDADNSILKVNVLTSNTGAVDYQTTTTDVTAGAEVISPQTFERDKAALVECINIPTNGAAFMRFDLAKAADAGTDSTWTTFITKVPR